MEDTNFFIGGGDPKYSLQLVSPIKEKPVPEPTKNIFKVKCMFLLYSLILLISVAKAEASICDFSGSGLTLDPHVIQPVYLSCTSGRIKWRYPRSALRIILHHPNHSSPDFRACIKQPPESEGARMFVEGHRSLLLFKRVPGSSTTHCFTSYRGQLSLYVEADEQIGSMKAQTFLFDYDLHALPKGKEEFDPHQECSPCTSSQAINLFCAGDFAARGYFSGTEEDLKEDTTLLRFVADKVFHQTSEVFVNNTERHSGRIENNYINVNKKITIEEDRSYMLESDGSSKRTLVNMSQNYNYTNIDGPHYSGTLSVWRGCGARSGPGFFVVIGHVRLRVPILRCAITVEEWTKIKEKYIDSAHCLLGD